MSLLSLYHQKTTKNCQIFLEKDLKDQPIGIKINQKLRTMTQQTRTDVFPNQTL